MGFFENKGRSTAISFKKEAIEHHEPKLTTPPQNNAHIQTHPTKLYSTSTWERSRKKPL
jgi:hypothetical protein